MKRYFEEGVGQLGEDHNVTFLIMVQFENLRVNSDKVQNVGHGQNLDNLCTPLI